MTDVIPQQAAREKIKHAVTTNAANDRIEAMALLVEALDELFDAHVDPYAYPPSPFSLGGRVHRPLSKRDVQAILNRPDDRSHRMPARGAEHLAERQSKSARSPTSRLPSKPP
jgi:hypothetical protein